MRALALALALAAAAPTPAAAQPAAAGAVRADRAAVEVLPPRAGASEVRTPEGFLRVEGGTIGAGSGSFGVYPAGAYAGAAHLAGARPPPPPAAAAQPPRRELADAGAPGPDLDRCRAERTRYLRRLLYFAGIDVDDPLALLDGLAGVPGVAAGPFLFTVYGPLQGVEPLRPLAWDQELRSLGRELAACQASLER